MSGRRMSGTSRRSPRQFLELFETAVFPRKSRERGQEAELQTWPGSPRRHSPRHLRAPGRRTFQGTTRTKGFELCKQKKI